jgi:hypothetical protein
MRTLVCVILTATFCAAALLTGCGPLFVVAEHPFVVAEAPADLPRLPLRVVLLRTPAMQRFPVKIGRDEHFGERLAWSTMQGLRDAASLVAAGATISEDMPMSDVDLICLPSNPYFDAQWDERRRLTVTITLEVTVIEPRTNTQRGLLLQAEGRPGRRPDMPLRISSPGSMQTWTVGVTGAWINGGGFDEAVNNALFHLCLDFAEKLQKRGVQYLHEIHPEE